MKHRALHAISHVLFASFVGIAFVSSSAVAQKAVREQTIPVASLLDEHGRLNAPKGLSGKLDISGWRVELDDSGVPIFRRAERPSTPSPASSLFAAEGDEYWSNPVPTNEGTDGWRVTDAVAVGRAVIVAGDFSSVDGLSVRGIARYDLDTRSWSALGDGETNGVDGRVNTLLTEGTKVYVGGWFAEAGGVAVNSLAVWDDEAKTWSGVGEGISDGDPGTPGDVQKLVMLDGDLVVGGTFSLAGENTPVQSLARWDGTTWQDVGGGVEFGQGSPGTISGMAVADGRLFIGGYFSAAGLQQAFGFAWWDGAEWNAFGDSILAFGVSTMAPNADGELVVAGLTYNAYDGEAYALAAFKDGLWRPIPTGPLHGSEMIASIDWDSEGDMIVGGTFYRLGGVTVSGVARWDGQTWHPFEGGVYHSVSKVKVLSEGLFVGGPFAFVRENGREAIPARGVALYSNDTWEAMGSGLTGVPGNSFISSVAIGSTGDIYVGGSFGSIGGSPVNNIAVWRGDEGWRALDLGVNGMVYDIEISNGAMYAGGNFTQAGDSGMAGFAWWDEDHWQAIGNPYFSSVSAIVTDGPKFYAAGIPRDGFLADVAVVELDDSDLGNDVWRSLEADFHTIIFGQFEIQGSVNDLLLHDGLLYAGGQFGLQGLNETNNLAVYDGESWSAVDGGVGDPLNDVVATLAASGDRLFVGGTFIAAGDIGASNVASFDLDTKVWDDLDGGIEGTNATVLRLATAGSTLYALGSFFSAGGNEARNAARWDGSGWSPLGSGLVGLPTGASTNEQGHLYVAGSGLTRAGETAVNSVALWSGPPSSVAAAATDDLHALRTSRDGENVVIRFETKMPGEVALDIYSVDGRRVATFTESDAEAGEQVFIWNAADRPAGTYVLQLRAPEGISSIPTRLVR